MPVEEADLVLPLVDPGEVAARVHQAHQEQPRLAPGAVDVDEHLEEIDLGELPWPVRQRHEDLAPLPLPLGDGFLDHRHADAVAFGEQHLVESRGGQPLFAACPLRRLGKQGLHPRGDRIPDRARPGGLLRLPHRRRLPHVLADGRPREPHLSCHRSLRPPLHEHLVPYHMHLSHPEHPPADSRSCIALGFLDKPPA